MVDFNEKNEDLDSKIEEQDEKRKENMGGGESKPRLRIRDGLNVFWILPGLGDTLKAVNDMLIHYGPYHRCGREDPVQDDSEKADDDGFITDGNFNNCYRCMNAWKAWKATGQAQGAAKEKFLDDMENHRAVFQAFDFSPFFELDGRLATVDQDMVENWLDVYLEIVGEDDDEARSKLLAKYESKMPEEVYTAAAASPGIVETNKKVGKTLREERDIQYFEIGEEDPLMQPDKYLVQIVRTNEGGTFEGRGGKKQKKKDYSIRFTTPAKTKDWDVSKDTLLGIAENVAVDIYNIEPEDDSLQARAYALEKFSDEDTEQYLKECDHSFDYRDEVDDEEAQTEEDEFSDAGLNPEDFADNDVLSTEDQAETEKLKEELAE